MYYRRDEWRAGRWRGEVRARGRASGERCIEEREARTTARRGQYSPLRLGVPKREGSARMYAGVGARRAGGAPLGVGTDVVGAAGSSRAGAGVSAVALYMHAVIVVLAQLIALSTRPRATPCAFRASESHISDPAGFASTEDVWYGRVLAVRQSVGAREAFWL
jgi:hypothetical protein